MPFRMLVEFSAASSEFSLHKYGLRILTVSVPENTLFAHFEARRAVFALNPRFTSYGFAKKFFGCPCAMSGASDPHNIVSFPLSTQLRNV
ncbi:hypothetical protein R75483_06910 [Paraburkholderia domus]|nr:hypothetical protein R75483_06910 [Paraburkholderia domus]